MGTPGESIHLSRNQPELIAESSCSGTIECFLAGAADQFFVAVWLLLLVAVTLVSLVFLPRAQELCERELRRSKAERDAFDSFLNEIQRLNISDGGSALQPQNGQLVLARESSADFDDLAKVREAYRSNVMAVPHFEEDYGESLTEHMSAELSKEIAYTTGQGGPLVEPVKRGLVESARDARDRRSEFVELLEEEIDSITTHTNKLNALERTIDRLLGDQCADLSYDELLQRREDLSRIQNHIEQTVNQRQIDRTQGRSATIHHIKDMDLQEYLYRPMEVTYPVLAECTQLLSHIDLGLRRFEDELIYRS